MRTKRLIYGISFLSLALFSFAQITFATTIGTDISTTGSLTVDGTLKFTAGSAADRILKSDTDGNASWISVLTALENAGLGVGSSNGLAQLDASSLIPLANLPVGIPSGLATLDGSGKVPIDQLPTFLASAATYQGTWDASANTPTLGPSSNDSGDYYVVNVAGSTDLSCTPACTTWNVGDWAVFNGTSWGRVPGTNNVISVFGRTGAISAMTNDYTWAQIDKASSSLADLTTRDISDTTGILGEARGGTNQSSYVTGDILFASSTDTLSKLTIGDEGQVLTVVGGVPGWTTLSGGAGSGTIDSGTTGQVGFYAADGTTLSGSPVLFIGGEDFVGIGTSTPEALFTVAGSYGAAFKVDPTDSHIIQAHAPNDSPWLAGFYNDEYSASTPIFEYFGWSSDSSGQVSGDFEMGSPTDHRVSIYTNGYNNPRLTVDGSGNVGIGTTSPTSLLAVAGTTTATCFSVDDGATCLGSGGGGAGSGTVSSGTVGQVGFYAADGTTISGTSTIFINGNNIGINTATPTTTLDVMGLGGTSDYQQILLGSSGSVQHIGIAGRPYDVSNKHIGLINLFANSDTNYLTIGGNAPGENTLIGATEITLVTSPTVGDGGIERLTVNRDGNVGIGTTTPGQLLVVAGTTTATCFSVDSGATCLGSGGGGVGGVTTQMQFNNNGILDGMVIDYSADPELYKVDLKVEDQVDSNHHGKDLSIIGSNGLGTASARGGFIALTAGDATDGDNDGGNMTFHAGRGFGAGSGGTWSAFAGDLGDNGAYGGSLTLAPASVVDEDTSYVGGTISIQGGGKNNTGNFRGGQVYIDGGVNTTYTNESTLLLQQYGGTVVIGTSTLMGDESGSFSNSVPYNDNGAALYVVDNGQGDHVLSVHALSDSSWLAGFYNDSYSTETPVFEYLGWSSDSSGQVSGDFEMGSPTNHRVSIYTNGYNNPRLTVDGSGNVGIGTTSPLAKLDIVGTAAAATDLFRLASSTGTALFTVAKNGDITTTKEIKINGSPAANLTADGPTTNTFNAGATISAGDLLFMGTTGSWFKANATSEASSSGMVSISLEAKTSGQAMNVALPGSFVRNDSWAFATGSTLFIGTTTSGTIIQSTSTTATTTIRVVGHAVGSNIIYFNPSADYIIYTP